MMFCHHIQYNHSVLHRCKSDKRASITYIQFNKNKKIIHLKNTDYNDRTLTTLMQKEKHRELHTAKLVIQSNSYDLTELLVMQ